MAQITGCELRMQGVKDENSEQAKSVVREHFQ